MKNLPVNNSRFNLKPDSADDTWLVFDLETNGLYEQVSEIFCVVIYDVNRKQTFSYGPDSIDIAIRHLECASTLIGHNILFYDVPVIEKLFPGRLSKNKHIIDTLLCSRLIWPKEKLYDLDLQQYPQVPKKLQGTAGLKAWGYRLADHKIEFKDFSQYSEEMLAYCIQDVKTTTTLFEFIQRQSIALSALRLEHDLAAAVEKQIRSGFPFDTDAALTLVDVLQTRKEELYEQLTKVFPPIEHETWFTPKVNNKTRGYVKGVPFRKVRQEHFNPGSRDQIVQRLKDKYGWTPDKTTEKGNPVLDDDVLEKLDFPEAKLLAEYMLVAKRLGQIKDGRNAWLNLVTADDCIHGDLVTNGCITGRCSHRNPNMAQVPASYSAYGEDCRKLFHAPDSHLLVGIDAKALELRCLAGYLAHWDDGEYASLVTDDTIDIHTYNQEKFGVETRDISKRLLYACVPSDITQVLTKEGWKTYEQLKVGELVLTYNNTKEIKEWKPILEIIPEHEDEVWQMEHNHSFVVQSTTDHRWYVKKRKRNKNVQCGWDTGKNYMISKVEKTFEINTESNIIVNAPLIEKDHKGIDIDWRWRKYGTNWSQKILEMNSSQRKAWLSGFMIADGHQTCKPNQKEKWHWTQIKNEHFEAALLASYLEFSGVVHVAKPTKNPSGTIQMRVGIANKGHVTGQKLKKTLVGTKKVFCIRTENQSFVMRQGNCITITGNCLYGAGNLKAGSIIDPNETNEEVLRHLGRTAIDSFMNGVPALKKLKNKLATALVSRGYLVGLDGRPLFCRSDFKALNVLLQSAGAIIMKQVVINIHRNMEQAGLIYGMDWHQHAFIHDEVQLSCRKDLVDQVIDLGLQAFPDAGRFFGFLCEIEGDAKSGYSWKDTH